MLIDSCISCATLCGRISPPGGIIWADASWVFFLRPRPTLLAGQGLLVLRRHCEDLSDLTAAELSALGPAMARVESGLRRVLDARRVHFGLYGEAVRHVHLHITPRVDGLPAGNIVLTLLGVWNDLLTRASLRCPPADAEVAALAQALRAAFAEGPPMA